MQDARSHAGGGHAVLHLDWPALLAARPAWRALADAAAEANVFNDPDFAAAALPALDLAPSVRALAIARDGAHLGIFPYVPRRRWGLPVRVAEALVHPFAPVGTPLLASDDPQAAADAFAAWLESGDGAPAAYLFPLLPGDGAARAALQRAFEAQGHATFAFGAHERAVLVPDDAGADYLDQAISGGRRKEFRRQRRRLADNGPVEHLPGDASGVSPEALDDFLAVEASGWKGRGGTAAISDPRIAGTFREAMLALAPRGRWRVDRLRVGGRTVAAAITLGHTRRWLWKIAYDETFAAASPGVQLVLDMTAVALRDGGRSFDSCARAGHPMIDGIWRQRRIYSDLLVVPPRNAALARGFAALERLRRTAEQGARTALRRL